MPAHQPACPVRGGLHARPRPPEEQVLHCVPPVRLRRALDALPRPPPRKGEGLLQLFGCWSMGAWPRGAQRRAVPHAQPHASPLGAARRPLRPPCPRPPRPLHVHTIRMDLGRRLDDAHRHCFGHACPRRRRHAPLRPPAAAARPAGPRHLCRAAAPPPSRQAAHRLGRRPHTTPVGTPRR